MALGWMRMRRYVEIFVRSEKKKGRTISKKKEEIRGRLRKRKRNFDNIGREWFLYLKLAGLVSRVINLVPGLLSLDRNPSLSLLSYLLIPE